MMAKANSNGRAIHARTLMLTQLGVLTAMMLVFHLTGIGFITLGPVQMTIMWVPIIIGAITLGPIAGAVLGGVFGLTVLHSMGTITALLFNTNPVMTVVFMVVVRGFGVGALSGLIFKGLSRFDSKKTWSFEATAFLTSLLNTAVFIFGTVVIFGSHAGLLEMFGIEGASRTTLLRTLLTVVGTQAFIEMAICTLLAATIARVIKTHVHKA